MQSPLFSFLSHFSFPVTFTPDSSENTRPLLAEIQGGWGQIQFPRSTAQLPSTKRMARRSHVTDFQFLMSHFQICKPQWELTKYWSVLAPSCSPRRASWKRVSYKFCSLEPTLNCVRVLEIRSPSFSSSRQRRQEEDATGSSVEPLARQSTGLPDGSQHVANTKPGACITFFLKVDCIFAFPDWAQIGLQQNKHWQCVM